MTKDKEKKLPKKPIVADTTPLNIPSAEPKKLVIPKGITIKDPQVLRPKELPLVITPDNGKWENEAQAEFAANLNAYAYKNTVKWERKKAVLLSQLEEIGKDPEAINKYRPLVDKVAFSNKLIGKNE